jgi:hypothetical protein
MTTVTAPANTVVGVYRHYRDPNPVQVSTKDAIPEKPVPEQLTKQLSTLGVQNNAGAASFLNDLKSVEAPPAKLAPPLSRV